MQIQLKVSGGIAYFPGLSKPVIVDTNYVAIAASRRT